MMKRIIFALLTGLFIFSSCDSFLDQQPIDKQTSAEDVFSKKSTTDQYLYRIYSFIPKYWTISASDGWGPLSDEAEVSFNHSSHQMNQGAFSPSSPYYKKWNYKGIREANFFLQNVGLCKELTDEEMEQYIAEARFLRAYYYFLMMRCYGPVVLLGDRVMEPDADYNIGRNTYEECVEYVSNELLEVSKVLYAEQIPNYKGRATRGAALALRARLLLYSASELFNPSKESLYKNWKSNTTGEPLMPVTYDATKWTKAAEAAKLVIDLPEFSLVEVKDENDEIDPYQSLYQIYTTLWNSEIIFGRIFSDEAWYKRITPRAMLNCWGGYNPTQEQVDAFAMANGRYPIRSYANGNHEEPVIDPESGYSESGMTAGYVHPFDKVAQDTYNMYVGREPRFYNTITWDAMKLPYAVVGTKVSQTKDVQFYYGGNSGGPSGDRSATGYSVRKMYNSSNNSDQGLWVKPMVWPMIRLAEIYLDYTEALIESGDLDNPDLLTYWNKVRKRAGVPDIQEVYPGIEKDQNLLREMIRRERQVELAYEDQRYFDCRRWMIMNETNNGYIYGMDVSRSTDKPIGTAAFWKRTPVKDYGERVFKDAFYFHPIEQWELDRNTKLEQAPLY
ncbi:MAG: RagB/SusD family nutrient uptake outer membrane protein [Candidatus Cryptobacteroides sp.]